MPSLYSLALLIHGVLAIIAFFQRYNHPDLELEMFFGDLLRGQTTEGTEGTTSPPASSTASMTYPLEPHPLYHVLLDLMRFYSFVTLVEGFITLFSAVFIKGLDSRLWVTRFMCLWMLVVHGGQLFVILNPLSDALDHTSRTTTLVSLVSTTTTAFLGLYLVIWHRLSSQRKTEVQLSSTPDSVTTSPTPSSSSSSSSPVTTETKINKKRR